MVSALIQIGFADPTQCLSDTGLLPMLGFNRAPNDIRIKKGLIQYKYVI